MRKFTLGRTIRPMVCSCRSGPSALVTPLPNLKVGTTTCEPNDPNAVPLFTRSEDCFATIRCRVRCRNTEICFANLYSQPYYTPLSLHPCFFPSFRPHILMDIYTLTPLPSVYIPSLFGRLQTSPFFQSFQRRTNTSLSLFI